MTEAAKKLQWRNVLKVLLSLGLILGLIAYVDLDRLVASITSADPGLLLAGFILSPLPGVFESGRLQIVFASFRLSYLASVRLFFVGMFFGNFLPGAIGTDLYQIYHMHSIRPGLLKPASLSIYLRLNGLLINVLLAVVAALLGSTAWVGAVDIDRDLFAIPVWAGALVLFLVLMIALMIASNRGRTYLRVLIEKLLGIVREFSAAIRSFTMNQQIGLAVLGVCVVLSRAAVVYILVQAFASSIGAIDMVLIVTVTTLAVLLPVGVGGLGVREISITALLIAFGVGPSDAVAISLVGRCFIWIISLVGGILFIRDRTRSNVNP